MAAPTPTTRITPNGLKLFDGYQSLLTIETDPNIDFWEKSVTPPGFDGGDPIEQTTMHNVTYRTFAPRQLITLTEVTLTAAYDPLLYTQIPLVLLVETTMTVIFCDGSTVAFFGYLAKWLPGTVEEGAPPECEITIQPTCFDPSNNVEAGLALAEVAGT